MPHSCKRRFNRIVSAAVLPMPGREVEESQPIIRVLRQFLRQLRILRAIGSAELPECGYCTGPVVGHEDRLQACYGVRLQRRRQRIQADA